MPPLHQHTNNFLFKSTMKDSLHPSPFWIFTLTTNRFPFGWAYNKITMWFKLFSGYLNYISTMDLGTLINELRHHKHLSQIPLGKVMNFIQRASALKRDIMQPQPLSVPINHAPEFLLPSISKFLAE